MSITLQATGKGDKQLAYFYGSFVGGPTAPSDEGAGGLATQWGEMNGYYQGKIVTTSGTGDVMPILGAATNGWNTVFDGGILLNMSKDPGWTFTMTGFSQNLENYLNYLPVTKSSAYGEIIAWGACTDSLTTTGYPDAHGVEVTRNITLKARGDGSVQALTNGQKRLAGSNFTEQVILYNVQAPVGGVQQVTFKYRYPNSTFYLVDSLISDHYISFDSRRNGSGGLVLSPSTYAALGVLNGNKLLYIAEHTGSTGHTIPYGDQDAAGGCEPAGYLKDVNGNHPFASGRLYPGAEVVGVTTAPADSNHTPNWNRTGSRGR